MLRRLDFIVQLIKSTGDYFVYDPQEDEVKERLLGTDAAHRFSEMSGMVSELSRPAKPWWMFWKR
jgi:hypothetical protein